MGTRNLPAPGFKTEDCVCEHTLLKKITDGTTPGFLENVFHIWGKIKITGDPLKVLSKYIQTQTQANPNNAPIKLT